MRMLIVLILAANAWPQILFPIAGDVVHGGGGGSAPTYISNSTGGNGFACFHTLTCAAGSISATANDVLAVAVTFQNSTGLTIITDNCNTASSSNTYSAVDTVNVSGGSTVKSFYTVVGATTASCVVTATYIGSGTYSQIYVQQIRGVNTTTPMISGQHASQAQAFPGAGTDAVSSGTITTTVSNSYLWAFTSDTQGSTSTITAGTGYTKEGGYYDSGNFTIAGEQGVIASPSTVAGTFTSTAGAGGLNGTVAIVFQHP